MTLDRALSQSFVQRNLVMKSLFAMFGIGMSALAIAACATDDPTTADSGDPGPETVAGVIAANPGATQVGPNEVQLDDGVIVTVPSAAGAIHPDTVSGCKNGDLCLFEDSGFDGAKLQLSGPCRTVDLTKRFRAVGVPWSNAASSIDNPAPGRGPARFYNNGHLVLALNKGHYLRDLSQDTSADGGNANDKIDSVQLCP
jgi:hypothetical protein